MKIILSEDRAPLYCRMYVIDLRDQEIRWYPVDRRYGPVKWRAGRLYRTPEEQRRLDRVYELRQQGLSYSKIGKVMGFSGNRAQQLGKKAIKERQEEIWHGKP